MKNSVARIALLFTALMLLAIACGGSDDSGGIEIQDARYRLARADLGAGYMSISNTTDTDVTLRGVSAEDVGRVEMHETVMGDDGTMAMESRPEGFVIASGQTIFSNGTWLEKMVLWNFQFHQGCYGRGS